MASTLSALSLRDRIVDRFAASVGPDRYRRYFGAPVKLTFGGACLSVSTPSAFMAELIGRRFGEQIRRAALEETGDERVGVSFHVDPSLEEAGRAPSPGREGALKREASPFQGAGSAGPTASGAAATPPAAGPGVSGLEARSAPGPEGRARAGGQWADGAGRRAGARRAGGRRDAARRSLDDFVVGPSNELAHHAALRMLEPDRPAGFSPMFIHGECGVGKTHLLEGVASRFAQLHPGAKVRCTTGEAFTNGFIQALRENKIEPFRRAWRDVDLLCIDDVHFLSNKTATQAEFLHTFNAIGPGGARVVMASDEHPAHIRQLSKELVSRFVAGMVVKLDKPDRAMRVEIARRLAARRGLSLDEGALKALAARCAGSVREIEGALTKLDVMRRLLPGAEQGAVGVSLVHAALGRPAVSRPMKPIRVEVISETVCRALRVDMSELLGRGRHKRVVLARSMTAHLSRQLTTMSYPEIARAMGRPNHSTIVTACKRVERDIEAGAPCNAGPDLDSVSLAELADRLARETLKAAGAE